MMVIRVPISTRTYGNLNGRSVTQRSGATLRGDRFMLPISRVDDPIRLMTEFGIWRADHSLIADGRFRGEADMHARVASISSIRSAEEVAQFGRGLFGNFLWKEMTGIERPAADIGRPGSP